MNKIMPLQEVINVLKEDMRERGMELGRNSLLAYIGCSDDQSTHVLYEMKNMLGYNDFIYERRVFGGIFIPEHHTWESLSPAAHHIPESDESYLVVLHFSHIGYSDGKYGKFVRYGQNHESASCGAISSLFSGNLNPKDSDLRSLKEYMDSLRGLDANDIFSITYKMSDSSMRYVEDQLRILKEKDKLSGILYFGGMEVDMNNAVGVIPLRYSYLGDKKVHLNIGEI